MLLIHLKPVLLENAAKHNTALNFLTCASMKSLDFIFVLAEFLKNVTL